MDPMEKLAQALEHVNGIDLEEPGQRTGTSVSAGYEAIRTYSLAVIAHEMHHARRELAVIAQNLG